MKTTKRRSLLRAITFPMPLLLFWQAVGWIAFGLLEPWISQKTDTPVDSGLVLTVGILMSLVTTTLGAFFLYYRKTTSQQDTVPRRKLIHKCLDCGHIIAEGTARCPYCGSQTLF